MLRYVKTKEILSIKVTDDDEHVHDSKALPKLVKENIIESGGVTVAMGKLLGDDDDAYEGNDIFRYLSADNGYAIYQSKKEC